MEQQKKRENSGYLFPNADKRTDKQPDYRGKVNIAGKDWLVSGWKRNKDGDEMISISLTDPASLPQREAGAAPKPATSGTPFARPAAAPAQASAAPAQKSFQAPAGKAGGSAGYDELEDLDSLFNGLDDQ